MSIRIGMDQLTRLQQKVTKASEADLFPLLDAIGAQQENSAKRRIMETKTGPSGNKWAAWSTKHAKTRHAGQSLLRATGALTDSMTHEVRTSEKAVVVGSNLVYAATHQFGDPERKIPARSYLDDGGYADPFDRAEVKDIVDMWLKDLL